MPMKFSSTKLRLHFQPFWRMYFLKKNVRKFFGNPRVLIFEVVADHQYHSSRSKWECWDFPNFLNPSNFKHL